MVRTGVTAVAPDRSHWRIRIRWVPRWHSLYRRLRRQRRDGGSAGRDSVWTWSGNSSPLDFVDLDDFFGAIVAVLALAVMAVLAWWLLLPLLLAIVDAVVVVVLLVGGVLARVLLARPWTIDVEAADGRRFTRRVVGWRNAHGEMALLAAAISAGTADVLRLPGS